MLKYIIRRLLTMIPVLWMVTVVVSALVYLAPGDPARIALGQNANPEAYQQLRQQMGLDKPPHLRYVDWLWNVLQGDLGSSITTGTPVTQLIIERLPATLELAVASLILMLVIALPLGIISAVRQHSWVDNASMVFAIFWLSMASFWLGLMLILIFAVRLGWFPISGRGGAVLTLTGFTYVVLPAVANGTRRAGLLTRMTRSAMVETLSEDYIRTAQ
ncbi:MAG: ABC transporter permease, partial [Halovenus sp.]